MIGCSGCGAPPSRPVAAPEPRNASLATPLSCWPAQLAIPRARRNAVYANGEIYPMCGRGVRPFARISEKTLRADARLFAFAPWTPHPQVHRHPHLFLAASLASRPGRGDRRVVRRIAADIGPVCFFPRARPGPAVRRGSRDRLPRGAAAEAGFTIAYGQMSRRFGCRGAGRGERASLSASRCCPGLPCRCGPGGPRSAALASRYGLMPRLEGAARGAAVPRWTSRRGSSWRRAWCWVSTALAPYLGPRSAIGCDLSGLRHGYAPSATARAARRRAAGLPRPLTGSFAFTGFFAVLAVAGAARARGGFAAATAVALSIQAGSLSSCAG